MITTVARDSKAVSASVERVIREGPDLCLKVRQVGSCDLWLVILLQ